MSAPERRLVLVVWCVDETQQVWQCRDNPPDPVIVAALHAVLARAAASTVVGVGGAPKSRTRCRPRGRRILLRRKEV
jgi:hypothetical protein